MTTAVIIDGIAAAILLTFLICGGRRGLFRSLAGLLVIVVALVGAGIVASNLTAPVTKVVEPLMEKHLEARVTKAMTGDSGNAASAAGSAAAASETPSLAGSGGTVTAEKPQLSSDTGTAGTQKSAAQDILQRMGLDGSLTHSLSDTIAKKVQDTGVSLLTAIVESVAESLIHAVLFVLTFVVLTVLLRVLLKAMDMVLKLPGLHLLNALGGAAIGLAEGALCLFLAIWVLRRFGVSFDTPAVQSTYILRFFASHGPLDLLTFL